MRKQNRDQKVKRKRRVELSRNYDLRNIYRDDGKPLDKRIPVFCRIGTPDNDRDYKKEKEVPSWKS